MAGVLPASTQMNGRLQALGYVEGDVVGENPVFDMGRVIRGHEFHYSKMDCARDAQFAYRFRRGKGIVEDRDGLVEHQALGSYLHTHFCSFRWRVSSRAAGCTGDVEEELIQGVSKAFKRGPQ